jgi:hypothetical protein
MKVSEEGAVNLKITRAEFLNLGLGATAGWLGLGVDAGAADSEQEARIARVIEAYDAQGIHRTARD